MPEQVNSLPWHGKNKAAAKYSQYFDGKVWKFVRGLDFDCTAKQFRNRIQAAAGTVGVRIATRVVDNDVYIQKVDDKWTP